MTWSGPGTLTALLILAPSMALAFLPPRPDGALSYPVGIVPAVLERVGQIGCLALAVVDGPHTPTTAATWSLAATTGILVAAYLGLWARYLVRGRRAELLFDSVGGIPIPLAVLPVAAFAALSVWAGSWWLGLAVCCLAAGHLRVSWLGRVATRT